EHAGPEALHLAARRIEFMDRRHVGTVAGVAPAAFEYPDAFPIDIDVDADGLPEFALVGQLCPILDASVRVGRIARLRVGARSRDRDRRDRSNPEHPPDLVHFHSSLLMTRVGRAAYCLTYFITRLGPTSAP